MAGVKPAAGKCRFVIDVEEELYNRLRRHLHIKGSQRAFFEVLLVDALELMDKYGQTFIVAILEKRLRFKDIMEEYVKEKQN